MSEDYNQRITLALQETAQKTTLTWTLQIEYSPVDTKSYTINLMEDYDANNYRKFVLIKGI